MSYTKGNTRTVYRLPRYRHILHIMYIHTRRACPVAYLNFSISAGGAKGGKLASTHNKVPPSIPHPPFPINFVRPFLSSLLFCSSSSFPVKEKNYFSLALPGYISREIPHLLYQHHHPDKPIPPEVFFTSDVIERGNIPAHTRSPSLSLAFVISYTTIIKYYY